MEKEFVPYEQALELKELGFDEPSLATYHKESNTIIPIYAKYTNQDILKAPLYQQAFRFFREKYGLDYSIIPESDSGHTLLTRTFNIFIHRFIINVNVQSEILKIDGKIARYNKREDAELECLKKLIEIVKKIK